ncbi:MAG: hypothetical protein JSW26_21410 [Desulfobacterales bacterium]|nr:MAG: hypothetical protein JSW26_21410 [Desulfobacterales bacterium]
MNVKLKLTTIAALAGMIALIICFLPANALAQCTGDMDCDGFPDSLESSGSITPVNSSTPHSVDPNTADLFIIIVPTTPSLIPANPFELYTQPRTDGGLGINIIEIDVSEAGPDREITATQKAAKITESANSSSGFLGWCPQGTVNENDDCVVYTQRIVNQINSICGARFGTGDCVGPNGETGQDLVDLYIKWVMVHELGHTTTLAAAFNKKIGNHYSTGSGKIMDQGVAYTDKRGTVTFDIPQSFSAESQASFDSWSDVH